MHPAIRSIFLCFDGLVDGDFDAASEVSVWSMEKILSQSEEYFGDGRMPFADFFFDTEIYTCSVVDPHKPILRFFGGGSIASGLDQFWNRLVSGYYDAGGPNYPPR
ncbi:MAG TPA: hypothetical protein VGL58_03655 [Caulobacteraceae bacterium]|jgi:hypothetical protein